MTRFFVWAITNAWVATSESAQAIVARFGTHVIVAGLVVLAVILSGIELPQAESLAKLATPTPAASLGNRVEGLSLGMRGGLRNAGDETQIVRQAVPSTPLIFRPRKSIITYTVEAGDTLFGIAFQHNLQPESVLWANAELNDNPDLLEVGMALNIPPVDGVMHIVKKGDTLDSIAKKYKVSSDDILNAVWNNLVRGQELPVGQPILVPGGTRETVVWQLPATTTSVAATGAGGWTNAGQCLNVSPKPLGTGKFVWPTVSHLVGGNPYAPWHRGIDLAGNLGDPVFATDSGTVMWAGPNSWGYGNLVVLDHGNGWQTFYAHLSRIFVRCGQQVLQGAQIGAVGSTGRSTGPHLHFETRLNGDLPNPLNYLR